MIPGRRVQAAFSFCDVRRFTDATECLEEEVMTFVNSIAAIVHGAAVATGGAPNKNVGDAFLCVWRSTAAEAAAARARVSFADRALSAAAAVLRDVRRSERLGRYAADARIVQRLGRDWRVRLGFGLHCGWAIEGAIGTRHKARAVRECVLCLHVCADGCFVPMAVLCPWLQVDPSYLSPHVNLAARLEGATKQCAPPTPADKCAFFLRASAHAHAKPNCFRAAFFLLAKVWCAHPAERRVRGRAAAGGAHHGATPSAGGTHPAREGHPESKNDNADAKTRIPISSLL
jgi:hypothetical protein